MSQAQMTFSELEEKLSKELSILDGSIALSVKFLKTHEEFGYNQDVQFWAASVIKIHIALTFYKVANSKGFDFTSRPEILPENRVAGSGIIKLLDESTGYTYNDLLILMMAVSDNVAANQIIDEIGWESVENYMKELGLENTTFRHKMMIPAGRGPNLTTAQDMNHLLEKMYNNEIPGSADILQMMQEQIDRSRIPLYIPNDIKISYKNGSLPEALHEVGIVYSENPFIFCFFSDDQKDKRMTNDVLSRCAKHCFDYSTGMPGTN